MALPKRLSATTAARRKRHRTQLINTDLRRSMRPSSFGGAVVWIGSVLALMWVLVLIDAVTNLHLEQYGIRPRQADDVYGVLVSPLLHVSSAHLAANTLPFAALGWLMLTSGLRVFAWVTGVVVLVGGLVDWLIGPSHTTIVGASGLIFGWIGYVVARAVFARSLRWIAIAVIVVLVFSSSFTGLLPSVNSHVYWLGHVVGFVLGVAVAAVLHRKPGRRGRAGLLPPDRPA
jgi:membrane associated rhomboid family serine protease